jgi:hypothetical protein
MPDSYGSERTCCPSASSARLKAMQLEMFKWKSMFRRVVLPEGLLRGFGRGLIYILKEDRT